ncbi:MAG: YggS family pyridoxal phosphate-dependent enzyme [Candidatus Acidiferrales bacterium]
MNNIPANIAAVREKITRACAENGRDPHEVSLVAVSKLQPLERIEAALAAGHRLFGENRVQEAKAHWADRRAQYPDLKLHLIGPLQTNKARDAVALFDCIETVDRPALADDLAKEMMKQGRKLPCFIQVNTGEEEQKGGVVPGGLPVLLDHCRRAGLDIRGLMCIPPVDEPPGPHFALLKKLARRHRLPELSMGMSADFEQAIALGATHIRIGTALFGDRGK